jgi:uncharacterized protein
MFCPICGKPAQKDHTPFCSSRCATIDLGKWINGDYAVPVVEDDELPDEEEPAKPLSS